LFIAKDTILPGTSSSTCKSTTLDEEAQEVRLLTLLPRAFSAEVCILLYVTSFIEHHTPKYKDFSFAWGSTNDLVIIKVSNSEEGSLNVTQDLSIAIRHLWLKNETCIFWIDAIRVDQQTLEEPVIKSGE
jgi:hypothetical protein